MEKSQVTMSATGTDLTITELTKIKVSANYIITDAYCIIKNAEGTEEFKFAFRQPKHYLKEFDLSKAIPSSVLPKYYGKNCTIEFQAQLSTGERTTFYEGALIK